MEEEEEEEEEEEDPAPLKYCVARKAMACTALHPALHCLRASHTVHACRG